MWRHVSRTVCSTVENGRQINAGKFYVCLFLRQEDKWLGIYIVNQLILSYNYFLHIFFCLGQFNDVIRPSNSVRLPASLRHIPGTGSETHTKRQATQHGSLTSLLGDVDKGIEIVYGEEKKILYWAD
jgi:hypothetical protein